MPSTREGLMNRTIVAIAIAFAVGPAAAATCSDEAKDKKLAGAAFNSFMKKCEADARTSCEASAKEKKLAGAAKDSFSKKCVADHVGGK